MGWLSRYATIAIMVAHLVIVFQPLFPSHCHPFCPQCPPWTLRMKLPTQLQRPTEAYADYHAEALTVHVHVFKEHALASALLSNDYTPCKTMFLDANSITPDLRRHVESLFPSCDAMLEEWEIREN
jgi:hypothetical protein